MGLFSGGESESFEVILSARDAGLTSTLRGADSQIDRTAERVKRLGEAFLIFEGLRKSIDLVKDFGKAAANQQAELAQVNVALKDNGQNVRVWGQQTADALKKRAAASGFALSDEVASFIKLEGATKNNAQALKILGVAQDVSRSRHVALTAVSLALAKGVEGNTTSLARYGIIVPKVTTSEDQLKAKKNELTAAHVKQTAALKDQYAAAMAQAKIQDKQATSAAALAAITGQSSGASAAYAKSLAGQADRTKVSIDELEASIGRKLIPTERAALQQVSSWVDELQNSNRVQQDATQFAHGLGVAWDDTVAILRTVGPPLLEIAGDVSQVTQAVGGFGTILAFGSAWYAASKSISLGATALESVTKFATPAKAALATAETASAAAAISTSPEAIAASAIPFGAGYSGGHFPAQDARAAESRAAETAIQDTAAAAEKAGPSLAGFGANLVGAFSGVGAATVAVGLLAGGIYYLSTIESDQERSAKRTASAFDLLASSASKYNSAGQNIQGDRINTSSDKLARQQASLAVAEAKQTLADPSLNKDALQHRQNVLSLAQAYNAWRIANHNVAGDLATTTTDVHKQGEAANGTQVAISRVAHSLTSQANAAGASAVAQDKVNQTLDAGAVKYGAHAKAISADQVAADKAAASLAVFTSSAQTQAATLDAKGKPALANATRLLGEFAQAQGRVPKNSETEFILKHARASDDLKTITAKVKAFDGKKVNTEIKLFGVPAIVTATDNVRELLSGLTNRPWVIPISYSSPGPLPKNPNSGNQGGGGNGGNPGATGMYIAGLYGADDVHVRVTGSEAILNPTQIGLVDAGWSVGGALAATGAPTIRRGGGYASGGGNPAVTYNTTANTALAKAGTPKKKPAGHATGHGKSTLTPEQLAEQAFQSNATSFTNSIGGLLATYAKDQNNASQKEPIARDLRQLIAKYASRASFLSGARGSAKFKPFPGAVAAINSELAQDYGVVGGYKGDLQSLVNPAGGATGAGSFQATLAKLNVKMSTDQTVASDKAHPAKAAAAHKQIKGDRQKIIDAYVTRLNKLKALRRKPPKGMLGAILDELNTDQQALGGLYGDQATDDSTAAQASQDLTAALAAAATPTLNNTYFTSQEDAINTRIAADQAALAPGQAGSAALTQDTQSLFDLVSGRTKTLEGILGTNIPGSFRDSINQELTQDYGVIAGITQGSTGAGGSKPASAVQTSDDAAIIAQLQQQLAIQTRSSGLANAALSVFGGSGDIGSGGYGNAWGSTQPFVQNNYMLHPSDPAVLSAIAEASNAGNDLQQAVPSGRTSVNL